MGTIVSFRSFTISRLDYFPYGEERVNVQTPADGRSAGAPDTKKKFIGQEYDDETGLHYFNARYYNSQLGRFISLDPASLQQPEQFLKEPQQLNLYSYAANSPITYKDPSGMCIQDLCILEGAAVILMAISGVIHIAATYNDSSQSDQEKGMNYAFGIMSMVPAASIAAEAASREVLVPEAVSAEGIRFSQTTANYSFSEEGPFAGETIASKAAALRQGRISPEDIPINYVERGGITLVENNRSTGVVISAGTPRGQWNLEPADVAAIKRIDNHLLNNNLGETGTSQLTITGRPVQLQDTYRDLQVGIQGTMLQGSSSY